MISADSETTGKDFHHGTRPFLVTTCDENEENRFWEWDVDPLTRMPVISANDIAAIRAVLASAPKVVLQNPKFDVLALEAGKIINGWDWSRTFDTLLAGHLLASNEPHDLGHMALDYLGVDIQHFEDAAEQAVVECRRLCRRDFPNWRIAKHGDPMLPSVKKSAKGKEDKVWKNDLWLPRAVAKETNLKTDHWYWTVTSDYANADSAITIKLWPVMREELERRNLWRIYQERLKLLPIIHAMESRGVTISKERLYAKRMEYREESETCGRVCVSIARTMGHELKLPKSGRNKSLLTFAFDVMKLPVVKETETGSASLDGEALDIYEDTLPPKSRERIFIKNLHGKQKRDTAIQYMDLYERFWTPQVEPWIDDATNPQAAMAEVLDESEPLWYTLHSNLNPTGTHTLRFSSSNPPEQNISKKPDGLNLREVFGPAPGREWYACDGRNLERRLPAYKAGEDAIIELFERPDDPPYYGSEHALVSHVIYPKEFETCLNAYTKQLDGRLFKKKFPDQYDRVKRGNFAVQNGAQERKANATYGVPNADALVRGRFHKQDALNQACIRQANRLGYVETMPDKTVDPERGYPIMASRAAGQRIEPTKPFSYYIQGTAMWWMMKAMIRVHGFFADLNAGKSFAGRRWSGGYYIALQVHDELVPDCPKPRGSKSDYNLPVIMEVKRLMELGGDDIGIPTPVSVEHHPHNYSEGISIC